MTTRTNEQWLAELRDDSTKDVALQDLREILYRGLRRGLVDWVNTSAPEFDQLADDFVQDALLKILKNLDSFAGRSKFTTWAHKIAVRVALTELRRKRWQDRSLDEMLAKETGRPFTVPDKSPTPAEKSEQSDIMAQISRIIANDLTERQRQAMYLIPIGGMPVAEAADRMGMNRNAMYKLLHDARVRLKQALLAEGFSAEELLATFES